jgi:hypothetical protein
MEVPEGRAGLDELHLDVYDSGAGLWNPDHGDVAAPDGWEFLPCGDPYLTRTVKAAGAYWVSWRPRGRGRGHRRLLGLWAPAGTIAAARSAAAATEAKRATARVRGAASRERQDSPSGRSGRVAHTSVTTTRTTRITWQSSRWTTPTSTAGSSPMRRSSSTHSSSDTARGVDGRQAQAAFGTFANRGTGGGSYSSAFRAGHVMQPHASSHTHRPVALRT